MQARWMGIAAVAALSLAGRGWANEGHKARGTGESGQIGDTPATQQEQTAGEQQAGKEAQHGAAMGHDASNKSAAGAAEQPTQVIVIGTVGSVDSDTLVVNKGTGGDTEELNLDEDTRIMQDGHAISRDQLHEGDQVRAAYDPDSMDAVEVFVIKVGGPDAGTKAGPDAGTKARPGSKADEPRQGSDSSSSGQK